jgi:hypothetical protein
MKLRQKQGFRKKEFELEENILHIKISSFNEIKEWTIKIENLGTEKHYQIRSKRLEYIVGCVLLAISIFITVAIVLGKNHEVNFGVLLFVNLFFGGLAALNFFNPQKKELQLLGGTTQVTFFSDSPSEEEVNKFIEELKIRSNKILLDKYGKIDIDLPEETQMNQLNWLKNVEIISEQEYGQLKLEYKTKKLIT